MENFTNRNTLTINEALARCKMEGMPIAENAMRRWVADGTLHAVRTGRKYLLYWPNVVELVCGKERVAG